MHFYPVEKQLSHMILHCRAMKSQMSLAHQSLPCSHIVKSMDEDEDQNEMLSPAGYFSMGSYGGFRAYVISTKISYAGTFAIQYNL